MADRDNLHDNIIRRMRFACWKTNATDTHSEFVILIAFTATVVTRTHLNVTLYIHFLSCVLFTLIALYLIL